MFVVGENEVCADCNDENPIVGLDDEDLGDVPVDAAEQGLFGSSDPSSTDIH
jgi:hypothetical protein